MQYLYIVLQFIQARRPGIRIIIIYGYCIVIVLFDRGPVLVAVPVALKIFKILRKKYFTFIYSI